MTSLVLHAAALLTGAAVLFGVLVYAATRHVREGVVVLLDLLLAAGLLRLLTIDTWTAIASVAAVVVIRKVAATGIRLASARRSITAS